MSDPAPYPGVPRWVKVSGMICAVLMLFVLILILVGGPSRHGPGRHMGSSQVTEPSAQHP